MKKILILTLYAFVSFNLIADYIVTHKGDEINCIVEQINNSELIYRSTSSEVLKNIPLSEILFVRYDNGEKEFFRDGINLKHSETSSEKNFFPIELPLTIPTDYSGLPESSREYHLFDYYNEGGIQGIVIEIEEGGHHGKIVALKDIKLGTLGKVKDLPASLAVGSNSYYDGEYNTSVFFNKLNDITNHLGKPQPLIAEIYKLGEGWYIPAYGELYKLFSDLITPASKVKFKQLNDILKSHKGDKIDPYNNYLSSTESKIPNEPIYFFGFILFDKDTCYITESMPPLTFKLDNRGKMGKIRLFHKF